MPLAKIEIREEKSKEYKKPSWMECTRPLVEALKIPDNDLFRGSIH